MIEEEEINYLFSIDHEDQDMIEMDIHVEDLLVIQYELIDLTYFLICELVETLQDLIEFFLEHFLLNDVVY